MKIKWNFCIMRSVFGDLWIGKTKLKGSKIFSKLEDAVEEAKQLFQDKHIDFDEDDEDTELCMQYEKLMDTDIDEMDEVKKNLKKFIQ